MARSIILSNRERRKRRIRSKISGSADIPRLCLFKSNKYIYAKLVNDEKGITIASSSGVEKERKPQAKQAEEVGKKIGEMAIKLGIKKVVFDRSGYSYAGKVKILADAVRKAGLTF